MRTRQVPAAEFKARCLRIIKEVNRVGGAVTVTNRGRPVAVLSPVPASEETHYGFIGMMRGTVVKYDDPFDLIGPWAGHALDEPRLSVSAAGRAGCSRRSTSRAFRWECVGARGRGWDAMRTRSAASPAAC